MTQTSAAHGSYLITCFKSRIGFYCSCGHQLRGYMAVTSCRKSEDVQRLRVEWLNSIHINIADPDSIASAVKQTLNTWEVEWHELVLLILP